MPKQPKPDAGYSFQSLIAAVARASESLTAAAKPRDVGLAGRRSKRKSKVRLKEVLPAPARMESAADRVKSGQSRAAVAAAVAGLLLVKRKRDDDAVVREASSGGTKKRRIATVRRVEGTKRKAATLPAKSTDALLFPAPKALRVSIAPLRVSHAPSPNMTWVGAFKLYLSEGCISEPLNSSHDDMCMISKEEAASKNAPVY